MPKVKSLGDKVAVPSLKQADNLQINNRDFSSYFRRVTLKPALKIWHRDYLMVMAVMSRQNQISKSALPDSSVRDEGGKDNQKVKFVNIKL
jgi:hypothetical protein